MNSELLPSILTMPGIIPRKTCSKKVKELVLMHFKMFPMAESLSEVCAEAKARIAARRTKIVGFMFKTNEEISSVCLIRILLHRVDY